MEGVGHTLVLGCAREILQSAAVPLICGRKLKSLRLGGADTPMAI
jgi:hypothetical protein